jgi:glycosyltransferase involved in cell wall biosynthesis
MKILWVNPNFLHPTTKGGQIRTLEMLRSLNRRHEVHYAALENPAEPEGVIRSGEYCHRAWPFRTRIHSKHSPAFALELLHALASPIPLAVSRFHSAQMADFIATALEEQRFDWVVCDFLVSAVNFPSLRNAVLFQHNVETMIWRRRAEHTPDPLRRAYLKLQADRMLSYERQACREARYVVAVSENDCKLIREMFEVSQVADIPTGVNIEYFSPPPAAPPRSDLVFIGSMDWMPNVDGMRYFLREILPLIRARKPDCSVTICGRDPVADIRALAERDPLLTVTGTVPDVRPYLWGSRISIVPLRIGGGTRLKIYESMAAKVPVVSTTIGAEGLVARDGEHLLLADAPDQFARACLGLLESAEARRRLAETAWKLVATCFSWEQIARRFEELLETNLALTKR